MRHYEIVALVHPDQSEQQDEIINRYCRIVEDSGGKVHRCEDWGRRKLAYPIEKLFKAGYFLLNIECKPEVKDEIENVFRYNDSIIRSLILRLDGPVTEQSPVLKKIIKKQIEEKEQAEREAEEARVAEEERQAALAAEAAKAADKDSEAADEAGESETGAGAAADEDAAAAVEPETAESDAEASEATDEPTSAAQDESTSKAADESAADEDSNAEDNKSEPALADDEDEENQS